MSRAVARPSCLHPARLGQQHPRATAEGIVPVVLLADLSMGVRRGLRIKRSKSDFVDSTDSDGKADLFLRLRSANALRLARPGP